MSEIAAGILPNNLVALIFNPEGRLVFTEKAEEVQNLRLDTEKRLWGCKKEGTDHNFELRALGEMCANSAHNRAGVVCVYDRLDVTHLNLLRVHFSKIDDMEAQKNHWKC